MRDIDFSDDAFGIPSINELGPGGNFIDQPHTVKYFRKELWFPKLLDRNYFQAWFDSGQTDMEERCRLRKEEILKTHKPEPAPDEITAILDEIVSAAKKELGKTK